MTTSTKSASATAVAFNIQIGGTGTIADGQYVVVGSGSSATTSFTYFSSLATKFIYDSNNNLVEQNPTSGYVAGLLSSNTASGTYSQLQFQAIGTKKVTQASCSTQNSLVTCTVGGTFNNAAVCLSDVYTTLWFGAGSLPSGFFSYPTGCSWAALYPVAA